MEIYGRLLRAVAFPVWQAMQKKGPMLARLDYLERTQWRSLDELIAIQSGALRQLVRTLYRDDATTRARFDAVGLSPEDVRGADDLGRLPATTQRSGAPRPESDVARWHEAVDRRFIGWSGHRLGQPSMRFSYDRPAASKPRAFVDRYVRRDVHVTSSAGDEAGLRAAVDAIKTAAPDTIFCDTRAAGPLARYVAEHNLRDWDAIRVVCGVERLAPDDRAAVASAFGGPVFETCDYGGAMLVAGECEAHAGLHVAVEGALIEIVVAEAGGSPRPAREGEVGEVVLTELLDTENPTLRVATGQRAVQGSRARCACGRGLPRIGARA